MCNEGFNGPHGHPHGHPHGGKCGPIGPGFFAQMLGPGFPDMMKKFGRHMKACGQQMGAWVPYNLEKTEDGYLIQIPLPGRSKEEVKVSIIGKTLNIAAAKPKAEEAKEKESLDCCHETPWGPFLRKFFMFVEVNMDIPLPENADENNIKSVMSNGLLKIKIGKKPAKNIDISENGNN